MLFANYLSDPSFRSFICSVAGRVFVFSNKNRHLHTISFCLSSFSVFPSIAIRLFEARHAGVIHFSFCFALFDLRNARTPTDARPPARARSSVARSLASLRRSVRACVRGAAASIDRSMATDGRDGPFVLPTITFACRFLSVTRTQRTNENEGTGPASGRAGDPRKERSNERTLSSLIVDGPFRSVVGRTAGGNE